MIILIHKKIIIIVLCAKLNFLFNFLKKENSYSIFDTEIKIIYRSVSKPNI